MKLIVISSPAPIAGEQQRINGLFEAGLECFHVRKPAYTKAQLRQLLQQIKPEHHAKIALHRHHELAGKFGIKRLHFTEEQRSITPPEQLLKLRSEGFRLSTSVHSIEALKWLHPGFSYTFFGPVFDSISKPGYTSRVPHSFCLTAADKAVPVIALGGIDTGNISLIRSMNFDGAAILGSIWSHPDQAVEAFTKINEKCQALAPMY